MISALTSGDPWLKGTRKEERLDSGAQIEKAVCAYVGQREEREREGTYVWVPAPLLPLSYESCDSASSKSKAGHNHGH